MAIDILSTTAKAALMKVRGVWFYDIRCYLKYRGAIQRRFVQSYASKFNADHLKDWRVGDKIIWKWMWLK